MTHSKSKMIFKALFALSVCWTEIHCAGDQETEEDLETTNQQGNLGQDDAGEGNGQENFVEGEEGDAEVEGEGANNALAGNLPPATNEPPPEQAPPIPNALPPENPAPPPPVASEPPPAPAANPESSPQTGGRVRYAKASGTQVVDAPGGSPVATLDQGDHPVTWEENGWYKLGTGLYISADALSEKGVPRPNMGNPWN